MSGRRTAVRLLFVALLALGVVGMHTLGHPTSDMAASSSTGAHAMHPQAIAAETGVAEPTRTGLSAGDGAMAVMQRAVLDLAPDAAGGGMAPDPLAACLAILTLLGLATMLRAMLRSRRDAPPVRTRRRNGALTGPTRGPPPLLVPSGVRLADLSVQRI